MFTTIISAYDGAFDGIWQSAVFHEKQKFETLQQNRQ